MGYYISDLKELPKIFNWHLFLIGGDDYHFRTATQFFQRVFFTLARDLGENSAIIAGDELIDDLNVLLRNDYELIEGLYEIHRKHSGLLMLDAAAMRYLNYKRDYYFSDTKIACPSSKGSIHFIPFYSLEYAYYSETEMYADIIRFVNGTSMALIQKTSQITSQIRDGRIVEEFNRQWYRPSPRITHEYMSVDDHDIMLNRTISIALQSFTTNPRYSTYLEDELNDVLRDHLKITPCWVINDQTRQGHSAHGTNCGELDILICDESRMEVAIIESLRSNSVNRQNITDHLRKLIHYYDPLGVPICNLIFYSNAHNFNQFWDRLLIYLRDESLPCVLEEINCKLRHKNYSLAESLHEEGIQYPALHHAKCLLRRNGSPVYLHVYAANIAYTESDTTL